MSRDDFPKTVIEALARRVGARCSNPVCRKLTIGPHSDPIKTVNVGVASHITAASQGGPRYDPSIFSEERQSINNGIWLCQVCAKLIDNDESRFTVKMLRQWKTQAEAAAQSEIEGRTCQSHTVKNELGRIFETQDRYNEDIKSHQESIAEDLKSHITVEVQNILAQLKEHDKTNHERLWRIYPFGYILFGGHDGGLVALPFNRGDIYPEADWKKAQIFLDAHNKNIRVTIPNPIWRRASDLEPLITINGCAISQGQYTLGQPVELNAVHIEGQPNMFLEVIDDNPRQPIYVLGFKK